MCVPYGHWAATPLIIMMSRSTLRAVHTARTLTRIYARAVIELTESDDTVTARPHHRATLQHDTKSHATM